MVPEKYFYVLNFNTLKLGSLSWHRKIEDDLQADHGEGLYGFTLIFPEFTAVKIEHFNKLMQGAYVFGEPEELDRNVSISLEMPEFQIGFIDMEAGILTFKGILNFSARSDALIFCMSDMLIFCSESVCRL